MARLLELETQLQEVEIKLKALASTKAELVKEIRKARHEHAVDLYNVWRLQKDSCAILFAKDPSEYYAMLTCTVLDVDLDELLLTVREGQYFCSSDLYFRSNIVHHNFNYLPELEQQFNIYVVDNTTLSDIEIQLATLSIEKYTIRELENTVKDKAIRRIS